MIRMIKNELFQFIEDGCSLEEEYKKIVKREWNMYVTDFRRSFPELVDFINDTNVNISSMTYEFLYYTYVPVMEQHEYLFDRLRFKIYLNNWKYLLIGRGIDFDAELSKIFNYFSRHMPLKALLLDYYHSHFDITSRLMETFEEEIRRSQEQVKKIYKIDNIPPLRMFHGTPHGNYKKILEDGCIRATNYDNVTAIEKYKEFDKIMKNETGFTFFDAGLDVPLSYCFGGERENIFEEELRKIPFSSMTSNYKGEIIELINKEKYQFFITNTGELLVKGNVNIEDCNVIHVRSDDGIINLYDEGGNVIENLCYE